MHSLSLQCTQAAVTDQLAEAEKEGARFRNLLRPTLAHPAKRTELTSLDEDETRRQQHVSEVLITSEAESAATEEIALTEVLAQFTATTDHLLRSFDM